MAVAEPRPEPRVRLRAQPMGFAPAATGLREDLRHPIIQAVLHILKELVASGGTRLVPHGADAVPEEETALYEQLTTVEGFDLAVRHLAQAHLVGASAAEIVWDESYMPVLLRPIPPHALQFGIDEVGQVVALRVTTSAGLQELPLTNAVYVMAHPSWYLYSVRELPLDALRRYLKLYDRLLRSVDLYLQRHGAPTVFAAAPESYTEQELQQLYDALVKMQEALVAVVPNQSVKVEFLEPRGTGMELAMKLMELIERLVARTLLGSVLAVFEAHYGTRAHAQVHWEVTQRLVNALQEPIENALHKQLWVPLSRYQFGREPLSRLELNELDYVDRSELVRNLGDLVALGMVDPEHDRDWLRGLIGIGN